MNSSDEQAKVALVTGSARRIGAEICRFLHQQGFNIIMHCHQSVTEAKQLVDLFNDERPQADLANIAEIEPLIAEAVAVWGRLDCLINNASIFKQSHIDKMEADIWQQLLTINSQAPYVLSQQAARYLRQVQGSIINITDIHAQFPLTDYTIYCMSKACLLMMTKCLAKELGPEIRVNAVAPGAIIWPEHENELSEQLKQTIIASTALKCKGRPINIAKAVYSLIDNDYISGQVVPVDGGRY